MQNNFLLVNLRHGDRENKERDTTKSLESEILITFTYGYY